MFSLYVVMGWESGVRTSLFLAKYNRPTWREGSWSYISLHKPTDLLHGLIELRNGLMEAFTGQLDVHWMSTGCSLTVR